MASNCPIRASSKTSNNIAATDVATGGRTIGSLPSIGPWQIFKVTGRRRSRESLPEAPSGMEWVQNEITYEWRLVKSTEATIKTTDTTNTDTLHSHYVEKIEGGRKSFYSNSSQRSEEYSSLCDVSPNQRDDPNDLEKSLAKFSNTATREQASARGKLGVNDPMCEFKEPETTIISSIGERVLRLVSPERPISASHLNRRTCSPNTNTGNDSCISTNGKSESDEFTSDKLKIPSLSMEFPDSSSQQKAIGSISDPPVLQFQSHRDGSNAPPTLHPKSSIATRTAITSRSFSSSPSNAIRVIIDDFPDNFLESLNRYQDSNNINNNTQRIAKQRSARSNDDEWEVLSADLQETDSLQSGADFYTSNSVSSQVNQQGGIYGTNPWNSAVASNIAPYRGGIDRHVNSVQQTTTLLAGQKLQSRRCITTTSGSVRSIDEADDDSWHVETSETCGCIDLSSKEQNSKRSIPYKIQRTNSNSTIDSSDVHGGGGGSSCFSSKRELHSTTAADSATLIGDKSYGMVGVDFVYHIVLPTDTLQGICLAYKISSTRLRQANHFSGCSLVLAPKKLVVPISKQALRQGYIRIQDTDTTEYKIHAFLAEFNDYDRAEAISYLELSDWCLLDAIQSAREDDEWEHGDISNSSAVNEALHIDTAQALNNGTSSTLNNFLTTMPFQQKLAQLNPVASAAAAATAVFNLSSSASPMSKSTRSKMSPVCHVQHDVPHSLQDKHDDSDSFIACDDGSATSSKSTNTFEYVMNDAKDIGSMNLSDIETHAPVQQKNELRTSTRTAVPIKLHDIPGAIATKSVHVQDMYKAASQHNNFGVELKSLSLSSSTTSYIEK